MACAVTMLKLPGQAPAERRGFTLMELLLVIVIIGIGLGAAMPALVQSMRWQRLRTAAHTMTTVSRYARSMALLKQSDLELSFDLDSGQIDIISSNTSLPRFTRVITGVQLDSLELQGGQSFSEGTHAVPYRSNGVCQPFTLRLSDQHGNYILVKVDALASVKTLPAGRL